MKIKYKNGKYVRKNDNCWERYINLTVPDFVEFLGRLKEFIKDVLPIIFFFVFVGFWLIFCILHIIYG